MSIHKLTAGDGYSYLTRQVAAVDATDRGHTGLADYYSQRGESPGVWLGSALADVGLHPGQEVTADQMASLFAEGKHPNADAITRQLVAERGRKAVRPQDIKAAVALGRAFPVLDSAPAFRVQVAARCAEANAAWGMPTDWPLTAVERARIRTDVGQDMFAQEYGRAPKDPRELSSFIARHSRQATTAVAGFDLTFTPVKSVSALWAIAPREVAQQIHAAHHAAVQDALGWLERDASYTRGGAAGVQQLDTTGLLAAGFDHRDSRAGDPDLHTHVAVSSKVRVRHLDGSRYPHGRWLALDGRVLYKATVTASERYNTRIEAELHRRLGLTFTERSDAATAVAAGRRTVREIAGVPEQLLTVWSARRARIDVRRAELAASFQAQHGRPPTPIEAVKLAQQATLETRDAKHAPRSEAEQRRQWRAEAVEVLGSDQEVEQLIRSLTAGRPGLMTTVVPSTVAPSTVVPSTVREIVEATERVVAAGRSTWQVWHVRAEAERQARAKAPAGVDVDALVERVVATVLNPEHSVPLTQADPVPVPAALRRRDGVSVYEVAGSRLFTSAAVLADEAYLVDAAGQRGGRTVREVDVDVALLESVANGVMLNTAQAHLVRQLATSGARVQLAIAPAGSGKTTAMAALTAAWTASGGAVVGLAPSAVAASILGRETGAHADTLAKLVWGINHADLPAWAAAVDQNSLLVVDEAGMAATGDLAAVTRFALQRGASVRLVGDDRQLASVAAGGVLRDIQATAGAVTLSELIRFRDQAEAAAGLAIRAGDTTGIGFYIDAGRVHVGDLTTVTDSAYHAWAADREQGLDAIMLAPTRELATGLNIRARQDRLDRLAHLHRLDRLDRLDGLDGLDGQPGPQVALADGSAASAGDLIITRRNDRRLRTTATDWVKNGDRWTVTAARTTGDLQGALDVVHTRTGRHLSLPADYARESVQLGYATTVHGGQGVTADTSHTVAAGAESRQQLYVALTRGRTGNHVYLVTAGDGDEHSVITPAATHPLTAVNVLEQILARDDAQVSATTTSRRLTDPAAHAAAAAARYADSLHTAAAHRLSQTWGPAWGEQLDATLERQAPGVTASPAYPTLRGHLALLATAGHDPVTAFTTALNSREIDTAADVAAVLDWRLDPTHTPTHTRSHTPGPLPWLPGIPAPLRTDPYWGRYLLARQQHVLDTTGTVRTAAADLTAATAPAWARQLLTPQHRPLLRDLAVFRAAHAVADDDTRPTGPRQQAAADRRAQQHLDTRVTTALDTGYRSAWIPVAVQAGLTPRTDPHWPALAEHLAALSRAGANAPALLRAAAAEGPLPDEYQAAALWWRIARHVSPAVLTPDTAAADTTTGPLRPDLLRPDLLRPGWLPQLQARLGPDATGLLLADPRWLAVVAAVHRGLEHGTPLTELLRVPAGPDGNPLPDHALADALIYRALTLTDQPPDDPTDPYDEPDDPDRTPPEDLDMVTADVDPNTPVNLADSPLDYSHADVAPVSSLPPPAADSLTATEMALGDGALEQELWHAWRQRQAMPPWEPSDEQLERALTRAADAEFSPVTPQRIAALNEQAARFYQHTYPGSWAQAYLTDRLAGADLTGDPATRPGYAPTGWTALTAHLRRCGATDDELLAAGLAKQASTGRLIDTFRDRLVLPIHHHREQTSQIVGFVGRRNPHTDREETGSDAAVKAGPKYLNTAETVLFAKGEQLYGMAEHAGRLAAGATPVLVEGPIDALAITVASPDHVGVAPLGTALTDTQADTLIPYLPTTDDRAGAAGAAGQAGVIVATDPDLAGQLAAERDYWMLTARGGDPRHATLPPGQDPADLLRTAGPAALRDRLQQARPLADTLIDERLADLPPTPALHEALTVVAAGHPQHWSDRTGDIARRLHAPTDVALTQLLPQITAWDRDRNTASARLIHAGAEARNRITAHVTQTPAQRWAPLARQIHPALITADDWGALANRIDRTHRAGHDVHTLLPAITAQAPLSHDRPATDLRYRLTALVDVPDEPIPASSPQPPSTTNPYSRSRALRHPPAPTQSPDTGPRR